MKKKRAIIRTLTNRSFKANKSRNLVSILAIVLTTLMFTSLFIISQSMTKTLQEMNAQQAGHDSHLSSSMLTDEEAEKLIASEAIREYGRTIILGAAENPELLGRQVEIRYADEEYAESAFSKPTVGSMPQKADEIALDTLTLDKLGMSEELGQKVTLKWRKDLNTQEYTESTFTLVGWWEGNRAAMASMAWVSEEYVNQQCAGASQEQTRTDGKYCGLVQLHLNLYSEKNLEQAAEQITKDAGLDKDLLKPNIAYDISMKHNIIKEVLPMFLSMILVFASGYLIIYNVFQISVASDIRFYGKLKTLGMSKKQLKKMIYGQANRLSLIGIPIGLILGYLIGSVLVPLAISGTETKAKVSVNAYVFIGSAVFAWMTVLISCLKPAKIAGKVSPMEALRYTDADSSSKRKTKKGTQGAKLSQMALANLGRNKKRTITVICSLTLGLVLLTCVYAKNASFDIDKYLSGKAISDFEVMDSSIASNFTTYDPRGTTISPELQEKIKDLDGLENVGRIYSQVITHTLGETALQNIQTYYNAEERLPYIEATDAGLAEVYYDVIDSGECVGILYGIDGLVLDTLSDEYQIIDGAFDKEKFQSGNYCLVEAASGVESGTTEIQPTYSVGDMVKIGEKDFEVMAIITDITPLTEGANSDTADFMSAYLPTEIFQEMYPDNTIRKMFFDVADEKEAAAEEMLKEYRSSKDKSLSFKSKSTLIEHYKKQNQSTNIMAYSISLIIAFIGILNFINSMVTAIVSRQKEFAMIQSIGMTKRQLRSMLIYEGLYYAGITLTVSYIVGSLAVAFGVRAMIATDWTRTFHFTIMPLVICTPILLAFAVLIPYICFKNLEKKSIVERLRDVD